MNNEALAKYKRLLEKDRGELMSGVKKAQTPEDFGSDLDHGDEEANETESFGNQLAEAQELKERVNDIDAALNKIRLGKYGVCDKCGKEIEKDVLDASPESKFCKSCKKKMSRS